MYYGRLQYISVTYPASGMLSFGMHSNIVHDKFSCAHAQEESDDVKKSKG